MRFEDLRERQQLAVAMMRPGWKQYDTHLINAACGFGKTALGSYLCRSFADRGKKVVFAAPYVTLVNQTFEKFEEYGHSDLSVIWRRDARYRKNCRIQIASADTLIRREFPEDAEVLIVDEAHLKRKALLEVMKKPGLKTIGLTATPYPKWMGSVYQNFIKPCTTRELIEAELLTPFDIYSPQPPEIEKGLKLKKNEFGELDIPDDYAAKVMGDAKIVGDVLDNWIKNGDNLPTIAFAPNVSTANAYCLAFQKAGITSEVITADTDPLKERGPMFYRFKTGRTKVLWNVGVLGAGFDADVRCIIWAKMTKSEIVWVQGTMRGSRPAPGKSSCKLFDHAGTFWSLGDPCDIEYYELHDGTAEEDRKRQQKKEKTEKEAKQKICKACGHVKAPGEFICSRCGYKPLIGEITVEVDESRGLESVDGKAKKEKQLTTEQKRQLYSELRYYALEHGKKDGWVAHKFRNKTGVWPNHYKDAIPVPPSPETLNYIKHEQIKFAKSRARK